MIAPCSAEVGVKADEIQSGQCVALPGPASGLGTGLQTGLTALSSWPDNRQRRVQTRIERRLPVENLHPSLPRRP